MASHDSSEVRFAAYVAALVDVIGHADRATPLRDYCTGLLMPAGRKSVEPIAAITAPARVAAQHQSLLHFVGQAPWSDGLCSRRSGIWCCPRLSRPEPSRPGSSTIRVSRRRAGTQSASHVSTVVSWVNRA